MKLAFCLFKYFPYGGLQRDFLQIAKTCEARGHEIHVYTMSATDDLPSSFHVHLLKKQGWQNHTQCLGFAKQLTEQLAKCAYDVVIGFNKLPHLDIYYAADVCFQARIKTSRSPLYCLLPRYKALLHLEKTVFAAEQETKILVLADEQKQAYIASYQTAPHRFNLLPPGIPKNRLPTQQTADIRQRLRENYRITDNEFLLLLVGSGFKTKGLDRAIISMAALPKDIKKRCHFFVIGQDRPQQFIKLARKLQITHQITFLGGRDDVPDFLLAADLLLHPAYHENTGTVLLEAILSGLPVLTVACCGYASYVNQAKAGVVLPNPFCQTTCNQILQDMLSFAKMKIWRQNGLAYAKEADVYSMPTKAADFIEQCGQSN